MFTVIAVNYFLQLISLLEAGSVAIQCTWHVCFIVDVYHPLTTEPVDGLNYHGYANKMQDLISARKFASEFIINAYVQDI